jgi:hypothetical protein
MIAWLETFTYTLVVEGTETELHVIPQNCSHASFQRISNGESFEQTGQAFRRADVVLTYPQFMAHVFSGGAMPSGKLGSGSISGIGNFNKKLHFRAWLCTVLFEFKRLFARD